MKKNTQDKIFQPKTLSQSYIKEFHSIDLIKLHEQAHSELTLQQAKRDHIITLYISLFSLIVPLALSLAGLSHLEKGLIFFTIGFIGIILSFIVIRYRIYKEVYWICCETITCMMGIKEEALNKETVQTLFYNSLKKKGNNFCKKINDNELKWSFWLYFKKNLFSSETLHFIVIALITCILLSLGIFLAIYDIAIFTWLKILLSTTAGLIILLILIFAYFINCQNIFSVLINKKDSSFNKAFSKAWFLHCYIESDDLSN